MPWKGRMPTANQRTLYTRENEHSVATKRARMTSTYHNIIAVICTAGFRLRESCCLISGQHGIVCKLCLQPGK